MEYIANIEDYNKAVVLIEEEFGLGWLTKKAKLGKTTHPVPPQWKDTKAALDHYYSAGTFEISEPILSITMLAADLSLARGLKNYEATIKPRLKDNESFLKVWYEIYCSALCVRSGFETQFIPTESLKTADLLLSAGSRNIHVECTRRDPYVVLPARPEGPIKSFLDAIRGQNHAGREIIIIVLSDLGEDMVPRIIHDLEQLDSSKSEYLYHGTGYGIYIHPLPPPDGDGYWLTAFGKPPFSSRDGVFIPKGQNPAWSEARVAEDESGTKFFTDHWRGYLHTINSHNLEAVIETFNRKRQQIPKEGPGIIFIDLDVSHTNVRDIPLYLDIVSQGLARCFSPTMNTRIWAVVLTTKPIPIHTGSGSKKFINFHRRVKVYRNPHVNYSDRICNSWGKL